MKDCQAYNSFNTLNSDHRIVSTKLRLSLRRNGKMKTKSSPPHDWQHFRSDRGIQEAYTIEVKNRFEALYLEVENPTADDIYSSLTEAHKEAAKKCVPKRKGKKKQVPWENEKIKEKRNQLKSAYNKKNSAPTAEHAEILDKAKKDLQAAYDKEQSDYIVQKCSEIENASVQQQPRKVWDIVKEITGKASTPASRIKGDTPQERLNLWKDHFSNLLGQPPPDDTNPVRKIVQETLPIKTNEFTIGELKVGINSLSINKSPGMDEIPAEVWKSGALNGPLLDVCNRMLIHGEKPDVWSKSIIIPVPKKGDLSSPQNYRGIALTPVAAKVFNKMLLNRIRPHLEPLLRKNQNGFRPGRSTVAQILTLRRLVEGIKAKHLPAVLTFVDFKKAFDSINRKKMLDILKAYGIPHIIVASIGLLYKDTTTRVRTPDGVTDSFSIQAGVLQGDTLAPYLFIISLDYALRMATEGFEDLGFTLEERRSSRYPAVMITDTDFADDIALISDNLEKAQSLLERVESAAKEVGLEINSTKTEFMIYNLRDGGINTADRTMLKQVQDFKYLGSWIDQSGKDFNVRKAKAWAALNKLTTIWKSNLNRQLKVRFFRASVETVLLYGSETWTLTNNLEKQLDGCYTRLLRAALNESWRNHMTNKELYRDLLPISVRLRERRLRFSGHCWRSKSETISQLLMWEPSRGKRTRGRPAMTYLDQLEKDTCIQRQEVPNIMENRTEWKKLIMSVRACST